MKTIMVATDFSERSDRALRRATLLARHVGAGLDLVHVVDDDQPERIVESEREAAGRLLGEQAATLRGVDGVSCKTQVVLADPFAGIVQATRDREPDLLVIGPHRRQLLRDAFVGTTAERTIRSVSCPVLMANAPPAGAYRQVLLTTDLSDGSRAAVEAFAALGIAPKASASILYVFDVPLLGLAMGQSVSTSERERVLDRERQEAERQLAGFMAPYPADLAEAIVRPDVSGPANEILAAATDNEAGLVVVGTRGRSGLARLILGSVAEEVLRNARLDVLAVPPRRDA